MRIARGSVAQSTAPSVHETMPTPQTLIHVLHPTKLAAGEAGMERQRAQSVAR
jgi:hypothetical protein